MGERAEGAKEGTKVAQPQKEPLTWKRWYGEEREYVTKQIGALENILHNDKTATAHLSWVLSLYNLTKAHLETMDSLRTKLVESIRTVETLQKRIELIETESSEQAKERRIRGLEQ